MRLALLSACLLLALPATATPARPPLVAIIDSGIAPTAELRPLLVAEYDVAHAPARPAFAPRYDHGTMVATIVAREARVPFQLISLRIDDPAGCPVEATPPCQPSARIMAQAILKAIEAGAAIINISLAMPDDPEIVEAVRQAGRRGILVVMAAGNDGRDQPANRQAARAGYPNAFLVGARDANGNVWAGTNRPEQGATGYAYRWQTGVKVETMTAAGVKVLATGTSFATPIEVGRLLGSAPMAIAARDPAGGGTRGETVGSASAP